MFDGDSKYFYLKTLFGTRVLASTWTSLATSIFPRITFYETIPHVCSGSFEEALKRERSPCPPHRDRF